MPEAFQINQLDIPAIKISVESALRVANFWKSARISNDDLMLTKWLNGEIKYDELSKYYDNRLSQSTGEEKKAVETSRITSKQRAQSEQDKFIYSQFAAGHRSYNETLSYFTGRFDTEAEGTPSRNSLQTFLDAVNDIKANNDESSMETQFNTGKISYDDYKSFLTERAGQYDPSSDRGAAIASKINTIEPTYRISELQRLYSEGYWGNRKADGTFDYLANETGFQNALNQESGRYAKGSPQAFEFSKAIAETDGRIRQFRFDQDKQTASVNRNSVYRDYQQAISDFNTIQLNYSNGRATEQDLNAAKSRVDVLTQNFNDAQAYIDQLNASPQNVTSKVPTAAPITITPPQISTPAPGATPSPAPTQNQAPTGQPVPNRVDTAPKPAAFDVNQFLGYRPNSQGVMEAYDLASGQGYADEGALLKTFIGTRLSPADNKTKEFYNIKTNQGYSAPDLFKFIQNDLRLGISDFGQLAKFGIQ